MKDVAEAWLLRAGRVWNEAARRTSADVKRILPGRSVGDAPIAEFLQHYIGRPLDAEDGAPRPRRYIKDVKTGSCLLLGLLRSKFDFQRRRRRQKSDHLDVIGKIRQTFRCEWPIIGCQPLIGMHNLASLGI